MEAKKDNSIEILRFLATLAVVMIHISMTHPNNSTVAEIGTVNYSIYSIFYALSKWAVPLFLMISGSLLLNPKKNLNNKKIRRYILRMICVLLTFGLVYALMEQVFSNGFNNLHLALINSFINIIKGKSWDHLWYVYLCIGIYLITPFVRAAVKNIEPNSLFNFIVVLFIVNYVFRFITILFGFTISSLYVVPNEYLMFYVCGYYCTIDDNLFVKHIKVLSIITSILFIVTCGLEVYSLLIHGTYLLWLRNANFVNVLFTIMIFILVKTEFANVEANMIINSINCCSFGIYLIHPFWINVIYRLAKINPTIFPLTTLGIICLWVVVLILSYFSTLVLKKIPFIEYIV